jgi:hypothetical protein
MIRLRPLALLTALALSLVAACATVSRVDAAGDVHAFLVSVRNNDKAVFERHVDRAALKAQLETRILAASRARNPSQGQQILAAVLAGPAAKLATDTLIQPQVFRIAAEYFGYSPTTPIPGPLALAAALRYRPDGTVCAVARKNGPCLFIFANEGGTWKLTGFEGDLGDLKGVLR